jgi:hypothetical protein
MRNALIVTTASFALAACAQSASSIQGIPPQSARTALQPTTATSYVYVIQQGGVLNNGDIAVYDSGLTTVERRFTKDMYDPYAAAIDSTGTLYLLNIYDGVAQFANWDERPARKVGGLYGAIAMALDSSNNLYIVDCISCIPYDRPATRAQHDSIYVYEAQTTKLLRIITKGIESPRSLVFDSSGNLYVFNEPSAHESISVYAPGSGRVTRKITQGHVGAGVLAIDDRDNLFATTGSQVVEYAAGTGKVLRTITEGIASPQAMALDASGNLYVDNTSEVFSRGWISVYAPGDSRPKYKIVRGIDNPVAIALDANADLYVANDYWGRPGTRGRVTLYAPGAKTPLHHVQMDKKFLIPIALTVGLK